MLNQITPKLHLVMAVNTDIVASKTNNEYAFSKKKIATTTKKNICTCSFQQNKSPRNLLVHSQIGMWIEFLNRCNNR